MVIMGLGIATAAFAEQARPLNERQIRRALREAFPRTPKGWQSRLLPDATMTACSTWQNQPPKPLADEIRARERSNIRYPDDGVVIGDWRRGEKIAQSGYGLRFTDLPPSAPNGGNCYACHQLSPDEVSFGTIGVSLKDYGALHKYRAEDARLVYEKIYNSQAVVACSLMPRFGTNGILSVDQIKDVVGYLMDPKSPVNRDATARKPAGIEPSTPPSDGEKAGGTPKRGP